MKEKKKELSKKHKLRAAKLIQNAISYLNVRRIKEAEEQCNSILSKYPKYPDAMLLLGVIANQTGEFELAISRLEELIKLKPLFAEAHNNLGSAYQALDKKDKAITYFENAIRLKPDLVEAHYNLGLILAELNKMDEALSRFEKVISIKPDFAEVYNVVGNLLNEIGRYQDAIEKYMRALEIKPDYVEVHNNLGLVYRNLGEFDKAIEQFNKALYYKPNNAKSYFDISIVRPEKEQTSIIENLLAKPTITDEDAMYLHYALGYNFNHIKLYSDAFMHFKKANTYIRKTIDYDIKQHSAYVDNLIETYSYDFFKQINETSNSNSELPVFIVGMPRSGTSLVEQILSSHPEVYGAGELSILNDLEERIVTHLKKPNSYPKCVSQVDDNIWSILSAEYLDRISNYSSEVTRVTDKMPDNFLRIGLIKVLFPKARIIHCQRNALDTCVSIFLNFINIKGNEYSFDLNEIGNYYLDYLKLMAHWNNLFPSGIYNVQYEELVENQSMISQQLIGFLGLEWDEKCIDYVNNDRAVTTASTIQVREPIFRKSVNRWKLYENDLESLLKVFKDSEASGFVL
jgi:tetratricopeptide (TPR) repeat protein